MSKLIIGLTGPIASGKEVSKRYLIEKHNAKDCKFSTPLRDVLERIRVPASRENIQILSTILRQNFGENLLAKIIATDAEKIESEIVVVDGVRRPSDLEGLRELPNFLLVSIDADPKIRYERMKLRNENLGDDQKTFDDFLKDHDKEADSLVPVIMQEARYSIDNSGSLEELYSHIDEILNKFL